jgi:hypothetical protein
MKTLTRSVLGIAAIALLGMSAAARGQAIGTSGQAGAAGQRLSTGQPGASGAMANAGAQFQLYQSTPWFMNGSVQQQLRADPRQLDQLNNAYRDALAGYRQQVAQLNSNRNLPAQQRQQQLNDAQQNFLNQWGRQVDSLLTVPQERTRFNQLQTQFQRYDAFVDPTVRQRLNLTPQQISRLNQFRQEWHARMQQFGNATPEQRQAAQQQFQEMRRQFGDRVNQVLTPEQYQTWLELYGQPFDFGPDVYFPPQPTADPPGASQADPGNPGNAAGALIPRRDGSQIGTAAIPHVGSNIGTAANPHAGSNIGTAVNPGAGSQIGTAANPNPGSNIGTAVNPGGGSGVGLPAQRGIPGAAEQVGTSPQVAADLQMFRRDPWFLRPGVQEQLQLNPDQLNGLDSAYREAFARYQAQLARLDSSVSPQQRQDLAIAAQRTFLNSVSLSANSVLQDPRQRARFNQLFAQYQGYDLFLDPMVQRRLNLTDQQLRLLETYRLEWHALMQQLRSARLVGQEGDVRQFELMQRQVADRVNRLLTPDQQRQWLEFYGQPYFFGYDAYFPAEVNFQPSGARGADRGGAASERTPPERARPGATIDR